MQLSQCLLRLSLKQSILNFPRPLVVFDSSGKLFCRSALLDLIRKYVNVSITIRQFLHSFIASLLYSNSSIFPFETITATDRGVNLSNFFVATLLSSSVSSHMKQVPVSSFTPFFPIINTCTSDTHFPTSFSSMVVTHLYLVVNMFVSVEYSSTLNFPGSLVDNGVSICNVGRYGNLKQLALYKIKAATIIINLDQLSYLKSLLLDFDFSFNQNNKWIPIKVPLSLECLHVDFLYTTTNKSPFCTPELIFHEPRDLFSVSSLTLSSPTRSFINKFLKFLPNLVALSVHDVSPCCVTKLLPVNLVKLVSFYSSGIPDRWDFRPFRKLSRVVCNVETPSSLVYTSCNIKSMTLTDNFRLKSAQHIRLTKLVVTHNLGPDTKRGDRLLDFYWFLNSYNCNALKSLTVRVNASLLTLAECRVYDSSMLLTNMTVQSFAGVSERFPILVLLDTNIPLDHTNSFHHNLTRLSYCSCRHLYKFSLSLLPCCRRVTVDSMDQLHCFDFGNCVVEKIFVNIFVGKVFEKLEKDLLNDRFHHRLPPNSCLHLELFEDCCLHIFRPLFVLISLRKYFPSCAVSLSTHYYKYIDPNKWFRSREVLLSAKTRLTYESLVLSYSALPVKLPNCPHSMDLHDCFFELFHYYFHVHHTRCSKPNLFLDVICFLASLPPNEFQLIRSHTSLFYKILDFFHALSRFVLNFKERTVVVYEFVSRNASYLETKECSSSLYDEFLPILLEN
ncbi:hypothetical protein RCL1_000067 [Eukaryota sp. TZLM3-RCL]